MEFKFWVNVFIAFTILNVKAEVKKTVVEVLTLSEFHVKFSTNENHGLSFIVHHNIVANPLRKPCNLHSLVFIIVVNPTN